MKRSNIIGIIAAAVVIIVSVVLISWYLRKTTPMLIQGTVECTTYKASSKVPGRIDDMMHYKCGDMEAGAILFSKEYGYLCETKDAAALLRRIKED